MNLVVLLGTIVNIPKFTINEKEEQLCNFSLQTSHYDGKINYVWCSVRGKLAELSMSLKQGNLIFVRGEIHGQYKEQCFFYTVDITELHLIIDSANSNKIKEAVKFFEKKEANKFYKEKTKTVDTLNDINEINKILENFNKYKL